jgi:hypothetical protein
MVGSQTPEAALAERLPHGSGAAAEVTKQGKPQGRSDSGRFGQRPQASGTMDGDSRQVAMCGMWGGAGKSRQAMERLTCTPSGITLLWLHNRLWERGRRGAMSMGFAREWKALYPLLLRVWKWGSPKYAQDGRVLTKLGGGRSSHGKLSSSTPTNVDPLPPILWSGACCEGGSLRVA